MAYDFFNNGISVAVAIVTAINHDHMANREGLSASVHGLNIAIIVLLWVSWALFFLELVVAMRNRGKYRLV